MGATRQNVWLVIGRDDTEWLARTDGGRRIRRRPLAAVGAVTLSHDGAHAICGRGQRGAEEQHCVLRLRGERVLDIERAGTERRSFAWVGPRRFALLCDAGIWRYEVRRESLDSTLISNEGGGDAAGARDGRTIAFTRAGFAWVMDLSTERARRLGRGRCLAIDAEARHALIARDDVVVCVSADDEQALDPVSMVNRSAWAWIGARVRRPRFSPRGHVLATLEREDGARCVGRWSPRSRRWSTLTLGPGDELHDVHAEHGDFAFVREGRAWIANPDGRWARSLGEGRWCRFKRAQEPQRSAGATRIVSRPAAAPDPSLSTPPRAASGPDQAWVEPDWPTPPEHVPEAPASPAAIGALRAQIDALHRHRRAFEGETHGGTSGDSAKTVAALRGIVASKRSVLAAARSVLEAVASDRSSAGAEVAAQALILRHGESAARWVIANGSLGPAIDWATACRAAWLPPIALDLARRSPSSLRQLWPWLAHDETAVRLLEKRLDVAGTDERRWIWDRLFEHAPREAVELARRDKDAMLRVFVAQKRVLAGDDSDPEALALITQSRVPEARERAYELLHGVDPPRAWAIANRTITASVVRWRWSATRWVVAQPSPEAARYFIESLRVSGPGFLGAFSAWVLCSGGALDGIMAELGADERACVSAVREDEAAVLSWLSSSPRGEGRSVVLLAAFAHPNRAFATRVALACGEASPPWVVEALVAHARQVPPADVARAARAHPELARRALERHLSPRSSDADQIRALKVLTLLGGSCAVEARLLAATSQNARVRAELASFLAPPR